jgi:sulfur carrier protein ThiS
MTNQPLLFQVKASEVPTKFIDVVGTHEAVEKLRLKRPAFLVAVEDHAILNGQDSESKLCSIRLEVIEVEVFSLPEEEGANHESEQSPEDVGVDPAFIKLRDAGFLE